MLDGLIILDKNAGTTSAGAVNAVKRLLPPGTRIGHAGTLDRFATGVLVLLVGRATRQCERVMNWRKSYTATVKMGFTTETDDPDTPPRPFAANLQPCSRGAVDSAIRGFVGPIVQRPPSYSAIKTAGRRASDLARGGALPRPLPARRVNVYGISVLEYEWPHLRIEVECGRGTYIRSIARDLGETLGVGGYLVQLRRNRVGGCTIELAVRADELTTSNITSALRPVDSCAPPDEQPAGAQQHE